jgi:hypothetical protein
MSLFRGMCVLALTAPWLCAGWSPRLAADYLDSRQKEWFAWPVAKATGGPCISCHTGATYLMARPMLRRALGEATPTSYETGLLDALRARVASTDAKDMFPAFTKEPLATQARGVEGVFAALFLSLDSGRQNLNADARKALDRMWSLQIQDGPSQGAWPWFSLNLDPYEMPPSTSYGAALAALAAGAAPADYRNRPEVRERIAKLKTYLEHGQEGEPLHNRLMVLWASTRLPDVLPAEARKAVAGEVLKQQNADGGWTIQSLGPWRERDGFPLTDATNSYATGLAAFVLAASGVPHSTPGLVRAAKWLEAHQDPTGGFWAAESMNKKYPAGCMQERFMRDAATAFAAMALVEMAEK